MALFNNSYVTKNNELLGEDAYSHKKNLTDYIKDVDDCINNAYDTYKDVVNAYIKYYLLTKGEAVYFYRISAQQLHDAIYRDLNKPIPNPEIAGTEPDSLQETVREMFICLDPLCDKIIAKMLNAMFGTKQKQFDDVHRKNLLNFILTSDKPIIEYTRQYKLKLKDQPTVTAVPSTKFIFDELPESCDILSRVSQLYHGQVCEHKLKHSKCQFWRCTDDVTFNIQNMHLCKLHLMFGIFYVFRHNINVKLSLDKYKFFADKLTPEGIKSPVPPVPPVPREQQMHSRKVLMFICNDYLSNFSKTGCNNRVVLDEHASPHDTHSHEIATQLGTTLYNIFNIVNINLYCRFNVYSLGVKPATGTPLIISFSKKNNKIKINNTECVCQDDMILIHTINNKNGNRNENELLMYFCIGFPDMEARDLYSYMNYIKYMVYVNLKTTNPTLYDQPNPANSNGLFTYAITKIHNSDGSDKLTPEVTFVNFCRIIMHEVWGGNTIKLCKKNKGCEMNVTHTNSSDITLSTPYV